MKIGVVGLGYIGSVIATELARRGKKVLAVEINEERVRKLSLGRVEIPEPGLEELMLKQIEVGSLEVVQNFSQLNAVDTILICVGTPLSEGQADLTQLENVMLHLSSELDSQKLIIIKSTLPPGTSLMLEKIINSTPIQHLLAFSPERLAEGQAFEDLRKLPIVVGGVSEAATKNALEFWSDAGFRTIEVASSTVAELVKLADNCWIDLNIAFGHELAQVCDYLNADVLEVIRAANTLEKGSSMVNILIPSIGVGGYCLTKDPIFFHEYASNLGLKPRLSITAREVNDFAPRYMYTQIKKVIMEKESKKFLIVGISFKNNSGDLRFSPAIELARIMVEDGIEFQWYDPLVISDEVPEFLQTRRISIIENSTWDFVANLASHEGKTDLTTEAIKSLLNANGVFVDGRRFLSKNEIDELKMNGFSYVGVGRGNIGKASQ
jgi:UDP-N-acetyl-D-mannosaminuronic acid dehydrogenase